MLFYQDATRNWSIWGGQAPQSELKIIKVVYSLGGKSKLASQMRYIHSASAKWSLRPRHHRQMITFVKPLALLLFMDTMGQEKIGTCYEKNGASKETVLVYLLIVYFIKLRPIFLNTNGASVINLHFPV